MIIEVQVPPSRPKTATAYKKFNLLENDQGIVGVAATITLDAERYLQGSTDRSR